VCVCVFNFEYAVTMLTLDARGRVFVTAERSEEGTHIHLLLLLLYTLPVKLLTRVILFQLTTTEILRVALTETAAGIVNTDAIIVIIVIITVINRRPSFLQLVIILILLVIAVLQHDYIMYYNSIRNIQR